MLKLIPVLIGLSVTKLVGLSRAKKSLLLYHQLSQQLSLFQFVFKQKQNIMYQSWSHASSVIHTKPVRVQNKLSYSAVILL
jgi:hypothetical protein